MIKIDKTPEKLGLSLYNDKGDFVDIIDTTLELYEARCLINELNLTEDDGNYGQRGKQINS